jgi:cellulose synthase (UDP-forming)
VGLLAVLCGAWYLTWRFGTAQGTGPFGWLFLAAEAVSYLTLVLTAAVVGRGRWRPPPEAPPSGPVDVFITVCGEPADMVEATVRAAQAIEHPVTVHILNDGRKAGKAGWQQIDALAARLGVPCFTRTDGRPGKAANLNHALVRTDAEYVVTIDADHVADKRLAHLMLGYFADARVGFVCSAQRFHSEGRDVLNNEERMFYTAIQPAKDTDGMAFSCGNGTAYRRSALVSIGGWSEWNLVEDLHTSYLLHAAGWRSAYSPRPVTVGTAPTTAAVYATQRLRWAMDSTRLLLFDNPLLRRGLGWRQRLHYLHTTASYPLALVQLVFLLGPPMYVFGRVSVLQGATQSEYLLHAVPYLGLTLAFLVVHGGFHSALSTLQSVTFNAPIYLIAILRTIAGQRPISDATEKGVEPRLTRLLLPQLALLVLLTAAVPFSLVDHRPGVSAVALFWSTASALLLAGPLTAVAHRAWVRKGLRVGVRTAIGVVAVPSLLLVPSGSAAVPMGGAPGIVTAAGNGGGAARVHAVPEVARAPARLALPPTGAYVGVAATGLPDARSVTSWRPDGGPVHIVHWFQQWRSGETSLRTDWLARVDADGAVPMITWEPWAKPKGEYGDPDQEDAQLADLLAGRHDDHIRSWAVAAAEYRRPLVLRLMHEMNGDWYPWSLSTNGNSPEQYVRAFRHVRAVFDEAGATNVSWVWSVNTEVGLRGTGPPLSAYYPGDAYVDWVSVSGLNWGTSYPWGVWRSGDAVFRSTYGKLEASASR